MDLITRFGILKNFCFGESFCRFKFANVQKLFGDLKANESFVKLKYERRRTGSGGMVINKRETVEVRLKLILAYERRNYF